MNQHDPPEASAFVCWRCGCPILQFMFMNKATISRAFPMAAYYPGKLRQ